MVEEEGQKSTPWNSAHRALIRISAKLRNKDVRAMTIRPRPNLDCYVEICRRVDSAGSPLLRIVIQPSSDRRNRRFDDNADHTGGGVLCSRHPPAFCKHRRGHREASQT